MSEFRFASSMMQEWEQSSNTMDAYNKGRADEREMLLNELWQNFCKYKQDINDANYGFVFVEIAFNEVKNKHNK